jgi:cytochrome c biogenesis protein CcdA
VRGVFDPYIPGVTAREEEPMNLWSWIILLAVSAALATAAQYLFFRNARKKTDYDWVYTAGGALLGGFTATVWYHVGPLVAGLYILPALAGAVILGAVVEFIYRAFIRPRQPA